MAVDPKGGLPVVGLFGTCGASTWRAPFVAAFEARGIPYFNPQVAEGTWSPGMVADENRHLAEDDVIVFPVTSETPGTGSLGEIGFSALHAVRSNRFRQMVFLVDEECLDPTAPEAVIRESNRARRLVRSKLSDLADTHHGIHLVDTLDEVLSLTLSLWGIVRDLRDVAPARRA
jgi:hypothetical protein